MGDPDLSRGGSPPTGAIPGSLPDLIRAGDAGAVAGFRNAHLGMVRSFCEVACPPELVAEACEAAFLDFVGRVRAARPTGPELLPTLLAATRSAAAGRFATTTGTGQRRRAHWPTSPQQAKVCTAMPELLAARANGELSGGESAVIHHLAACAVCTASAMRMRAAEEAFSSASTGPEPTASAGA